MTVKCRACYDRMGSIRGYVDNCLSLFPLGFYCPECVEYLSSRYTFCSYSKEPCVSASEPNVFASEAELLRFTHQDVSGRSYQDLLQEYQYLKALDTHSKWIVDRLHVLAKHLSLPSPDVDLPDDF